VHPVAEHQDLRVEDVVRRVAGRDGDRAGSARRAQADAVVAAEKIAALVAGGP
jgi:hypothetical protein